MQLTPTSEKTSEEQKKKLEFIIHSNDIGDFMKKNEFNTENYKPKQEESKEVNIKPSPSFSSIRKESYKPLESISKEETTNNNNFVLNLYKNDSFNNLQKYLNNFTDKNTKNVDFDFVFKPSQSVLKQIKEKFIKNNNTSYNNVLKSQPSYIPALKEGGIVKEPTVAYLHENEAVVPLNRIDKFSEFIKSTTKNSIKNNSNNSSSTNNVKNDTMKVSNLTNNSNESVASIAKNDINSMLSQLQNNTANESTITKNQTNNIKNTSRNTSKIIKNENISNVNDIRKTMNERNMALKTYNQQTQTRIENKQNSQPINAPTIVNNNTGKSGMEFGEARLGSVYGGSGSRGAFMTGTFKIPSWRTTIG